MKTIIEDNPEHVGNFASIESMEKQEFVGTDADLATSLFEYHLAWRELETEFLFVYGIDGCERFDRATLAKNIDPLKEWNWVNWEDLRSFTGLTEEQQKELPLPIMVSDLLSYYGFENIFGSSYWEGFKISEE